MRDDDFDLDNDLPRTSEDRRNRIVDRRLGRGLLGMAGAMVSGASVVVVDKATGKWLMGLTLFLLAASGTYIVRTVRRKHRHRKGVFTSVDGETR